MTFFFLGRLFKAKPRAIGATAVSLMGLGLGACSAGAASDSSSDDGDPESDEDGTSDIVSLGRGEDTDPDFADGVYGSPSDGGAGGSSGDECLSFMSWGSVAIAGAVPGADGMDAIVSWLGESSTAKGEHYAQKPDVTPEFLAQADVILLQDLSGWEFSDEEIQHFKEWVNAGGGLLALSGYATDTDAAQVLTTNRLLSFSGLNYVNVSEGGDTSTILGVCAYCLGTTDRQEGFNPEHPIASGVTAVGAYEGRSIQGEGAIVAQEEGKVLGITTEPGDGRVFLFHDDWVSYRGSWSQGAPTECAQNVECAEVSPATTYQIPRFWFNAFSWLAGEPGCFVIEGVATD